MIFLQIKLRVSGALNASSQQELNKLPISILNRLLFCKNLRLSWFICFLVDFIRMNVNNFVNHVNCQIKKKKQAGHRLKNAQFGFFEFRTLERKRLYARSCVGQGQCYCPSGGQCPNCTLRKIHAHTQARVHRKSCGRAADKKVSELRGIDYENMILFLSEILVLNCQCFISILDFLNWHRRHLMSK